MGFWAVRELGYAIGRDEGGIGVGNFGSVGSARVAKVIWGRRMRLMSMDQGLGEGSIVEVQKEETVREY